MNANQIVREMTERGKGKRWFFGLDRDGTLVPIMERPELAVVDPDVRKAVNELAQRPNFTVAIVSARGNVQLTRDFSRDHVILAGNYGMEIVFPDQTEFVNPEAERARPTLSLARAFIEARLSRRFGAILEDHGLTLCLHDHLVRPEFRDKVEQVVELVKKSFPDLAYVRLSTGYDVRPSVDWDKGQGLAQIDRMLHFNPDDLFCVFLGDSETDEPAFRFVNERGGVSVRVAADADSQTSAQYTLATPDDVYALIEGLLPLTKA